MKSEFEKELIKRVQPFLFPIPKNNTTVVTLEQIKNDNANLRHVDNSILEQMFDINHSSINCRIENAMDQFEDIFSHMTEIAKLEMIYDYPEIREVMNALYLYTRTEKTADSVKALYNLTKGLKLHSRVFEYETPYDVQLKLEKIKQNEPEGFEAKMLQTFDVFSDLEMRMQLKIEEDNRLEQKRIQEQLQLEEQILNNKLEQDKIENQKLEMAKVNENRKKYRHHPNYINPQYKME